MQESTEEAAAIRRPAPLSLEVGKMQRPHSSPQLSRPPRSQLVHVQGRTPDMLYDCGQCAAIPIRAPSPLHNPVEPSAVGSSSVQDAKRSTELAGIPANETAAWALPDRGRMHEQQGQAPATDAAGNECRGESAAAADAQRPLWQRVEQCAELTVGQTLKPSASASFIHRDEWRSSWRPPAAKQTTSMLDAFVATTGAEMQLGRRFRVECAGTVWHDKASGSVLLG